MNWNELTVEHYQKLYKTITSEGKSNLDVLVEVISTCEGIAEDEIDSWPFEKLVQKEKEYSFLEALNFDKTAKNYIDANGKRYYFVHQIEKIPAAKFSIQFIATADFPCPGLAAKINKSVGTKETMSSTVGKPH